MLKLPIQPNPCNAVDVVFNGLANFLDQAMEEDKHFEVFLYQLSKYSVVEDLPPVISMWKVSWRIWTTG